MSIKAVFFDLDGTLLPMDQEMFIQSYFGRLCKKMAPFGYDAKTLVKGIWGGTQAMIENDGSCRNEERFWQVFPTLCGKDILNHVKTLDDYYANEFQQVQGDCGFDPNAAKAVALVKSFGWMAVLATNPIFPLVATESRVRWAGLDLQDFDYYTVYENSSFCKPNLRYYQSMLEHLNLKPEEVLMVGNDVGEDMIAEGLGMRVFLLTHSLINKKNEDINRWPHGDFEDFFEYIKRIAEE
ncbi:MAG: HAD family hydrolase [Clostridia bacterium]|nr:HAD family hydrolase [Clostridia bacterium]